MAKPNKQEEAQPQELNPKQIRLRAKQREHDRKLYTWVGGTIALALLLLAIGAIYTYAVIPNRSFASVGDKSISTSNFWNRMRLQKSNLISRLAYWQQLEQQFGKQSFIDNSINEIQSTLSSPFTLASQTLNTVLEEFLVDREATARKIVVSEEDVTAALREEVANGQGAITEPQATSTAEAIVTATLEAGATATAEAAATAVPAVAAPAAEAITNTETVSDTEAITTSAVVDANAAVTDAVTDTVTDTVAMTETAAAAVTETTVVTEAETTAAQAVTETAVVAAEAVTSTEAVTTTEAVSATDAPAASAEIIAANVVSDAVNAVAPAAVQPADAITPTDVISPTATPEPVATGVIISETGFTDGQKLLETNLQSVANINLAEYKEIKRLQLLRDKLREEISKDVPKTEKQVKARHILLREIIPTPVITETAGITPTATATPLSPNDPTPTATPAPRTLEQTMAQAKELKARIDAGEDFAVLAAQYSEDPGSGLQGGDLGWFKEGAMVAEFNKVAFSLEPGQVSEPFTTTYGVHIIKLDEKDDNRPKDQQTLQADQDKAYDDWLQKQLASEDVKRPDDLVSNLPRDLR